MSTAAGRLDLGPRQDREHFQWGSLLLLAPSIGLLGLLFFAPIGYALYLGFTNLELIGPRSHAYALTGLDNVRRLLSDGIYRKAFVLTLVFVLGSAIIGQTALGMILALLMRRAFRFIRLTIGAVVVVAWVLPEITAALIWYAFSQAGGTLGILLGKPSVDYLTAVPMLIVCVANLWRNVAFSMLVFSAGLRNVPGEVAEAAEVEGASALRRLLSVTLPIMRPTIVTNLLLVTLLNLSDFTLIYAMTQGGPNTDTTTLPIYVYLEAFQYSQLGYGTAVALTLMAIGAALALLFVSSSREDV